MQAKLGDRFTLRDGLVVRFEVFDDPVAAFRAAGLEHETETAR